MDETVNALLGVFLILAGSGLILWIFISNSIDKSREAENGGKEKNTDKAPSEQTNTVPPKQTETTGPAETPRKAPVLAIVACALLGAFILGQLGNTLELTGGRFNASVMGYTIGVLSFAIAAFVLMIVDTVKRMR